MAIDRNGTSKTVKIIPATKSRYTAAPITEKKKRVAAYARVSTDHEEQQSSYEAQISYYTLYIQGKPGWEFVGMYSDEGITGTNTKKRDGFNQMVKDALDGKIDLIITKSVSRFARNTVDSLSTIRCLKEHGVECYFEKENIWTFDSKGELLITIMSSLAQEESRSISENTLWGIRKSFQDGNTYVPFKHFLGYDRGPDGEMVINQEQAVTVRYIYRRFLDGLSYSALANELTEKGVKTPFGYEVWKGPTVRNILQNEKYKGDALLQKKYTDNFLNKKMIKNHGEVPMYYVEENHEPIIEPFRFQIVQEEIARRKAMGYKYSGQNIFSTKIRCAKCGGWYGPAHWHSNTPGCKIIWRCNEKYRPNKPKCQSPNLDISVIQNAFLKDINENLEYWEEIKENLLSVKHIFFNDEILQADQMELKEKLISISDEIEMAIDYNARFAQNQEIYRRKFNELTERYYQLKGEMEAVVEKIGNYNESSSKIEDFVGNLEMKSFPISEFDESLWISLVDYVEVYDEEKIRVQYREQDEGNGSTKC